MNQADGLDDARIDWLRLARTRHVGPVNFLKLVRRYGTASDALEALPDLARQSGARQPEIPDDSCLTREIRRVTSIGAQYVMSCDETYPDWLKAIADPPPVLTVLGDTGLLDRPGCAIVGARNASAAGLRFARDLAADISAAGFPVISGLARGIDGAAHSGALDKGTIAVVAGGIDHFYPPEHRDLQIEIGERGILLSEMPVGWSPTARDFPRRNRLISGLSKAVIIVEAALKSGSLITARLAGEQGRDVFSVPGSPMDPRARGTNRLIRDGAMIVESAEDVVRVLSALSALPPGRLFEPAAAGPDGLVLDDEFDPSPPAATAAIDDKSPPAADAPLAPETTLRDLISPTPVSVDELIRQSAIPAGRVRALLIEFELSGIATLLPGGFVQSTDQR